MKKLILASVVAMSLAISGTAIAADSSQCTGPVINLPAKSYETLNVSGKVINIGLSSLVTVKGNDNCITGERDSITVKGNNNYVKTKQSSVKMVGTNNLFDSSGLNSVNCGGNTAILQLSDAPRNCVVAE